MASSADLPAGRVLVMRPSQLATPLPFAHALGGASADSADVMDTSLDSAPASPRVSGDTDAHTGELAGEPDVEPTGPPPGELIDARIRELERERGWVGVMNNLGLEYQADGGMANGDTLVVMQFPDAVAQWPPASRFVRCDGSQWRSVRFRVHSNKLRHMGSNVFSEMFQPKQQARILRRLRLTVDTLPSGIIFVIDLTPPSEGDESASLLAMLSLPVSVRAWWQSKERLGVDSSLVSGHDDSCPEHKIVPINCARKDSWFEAESQKPQDSRAQTAAQTATQTATTQSGMLYLDDIMPSPSREIPDYCPIRHRASVLRLLESIECGDHGLVLDSAPRVYTMAKMAKYFECITAVRDHICSWLLHNRNSQFTEMHPEAALSISWDLELRDPTRVAFRIRVVEDAIELVDPQPICTVQQLGKKTVFGRPREPLSDELETAIEHARVRLIERVRYTADCLLAPSHAPMDFLFGPDSRHVSSQWRILVAMGRMLGSNVAGHSGHGDLSGYATINLADVSQEVLHDAYNALDGLATALCAYVRALVSYALEPPRALSTGRVNNKSADCNFAKADVDRECYYVGRSSFRDTKSLYRNLSNYQRLLTRYPWERLKTDHDGPPRFLTTFSTGGIPISYRVELLNRCLTPLAHHFPAGHVKIDAYGTWKIFDVDEFAVELSSAVNQMADAWIGINEVEIPLLRTSYLAMGLSPDELAYLPLWAGGNNDETGGIFNEHTVPDSDMGPIQPGPSYHTGCSVPSIVSSIAQSTPTASADSDVSDATMTAGRSIKAAPTTRSAPSVRPLNDNRFTLPSILDPAAHGDTTDKTPVGGDSADPDREGYFNFTVADGEYEDGWATDDVGNEYVV